MRTVTIITVCFNNEETIARTLESVAIQTYPNIQHVIVDGGSTDNTLEILAKHISNISRIISEPDQGIYDAMNKGLKFAKGSIVGFLNADDFYCNDKVLEDVVTLFNSDHLEAVIGDVVYFAPDNPNKTIRRYRSNNFSPSKIQWGWMPAHPALFLDSKLYDEFGCFDPSFKIAGDFDLIARIFSKRPIRYANLDRPLVNMQLGGISTKDFSTKIKLNREVYKACKQNGIKTNYLKILTKYPFKFLEYFNH